MMNIFKNNEEENLKNQDLYERNIDNDVLDRKDLSDDEKIKLHEERLRVNKDVVQSGEVIIDKDVVTDRQEFDVPVTHDEVTVERRKVNEKVVDNYDFNESLNDEIVIPLTEEKINVTKENVVAEELVIKKNKVQDVEHVNETVRKEEVEINDTNLHKNKDVY